MSATSVAPLRVGRGCAFFESALDVGGLGEQCFAGVEPFAVLTGWPDRLTIDWADGPRRETIPGDTRRLLRAWFDRQAGAARTVRGALAGYFAYEWNAPHQPTGMPLFELCAYEEFGPCARDDFPAPTGDFLGVDPAAITESLSRPAHAAAVARIRDYIAAGDVYQVNLTQRFDAPLTGDPYALYCRLRRLNPAPFAAYIDTGGMQIASASPERLLRVQGRRADTRPIKGTRRRGQTPAEDAALKAELLASPKDRAELLMIADLARNDLGQVCAFGSVEVERLWELETHPTVHHLSAQVAGTLRPDVHVLDALLAVFPGGSITGAPKKRAMEVIRELEPCPRHAYTGAIGYLTFAGDCDLSMGIRSFFCREGRVRFHAGGGIVWDSEAGAEHAELEAKAAALRAALLGP